MVQNSLVLFAVFRVCCVQQFRVLYSLFPVPCSYRVFNLSTLALLYSIIHNSLGISFVLCELGELVARVAWVPVPVRCWGIIAGCMQLFHIIMLHSKLRATETGLSIYPLCAIVFRSHTPQNRAFVCHAKSTWARRRNRTEKNRTELNVYCR